ncbi:hypothetical protein PRZ48_009169 [Zasmidium cellare]|uniref:NADP-dependent oxidoreductase domain-containing protein n=1 Tax=Zasmidium cellare TaxID=395010 RepID=A0ABR0EBC3_ZASCE|nr:hypothetical protein PRZ48_009169 [Zasmidium cellare]
MVVATKFTTGFKTAEKIKANFQGIGTQDDKYARLAGRLQDLAKAKNTAVTSIALAYVRHKAPHVFPIIGGRKIEHLKDNIKALGVHLTSDEINDIDDSEPFDVGFPLSFLFAGKPYRTEYVSSDLPLLSSNTALESMLKPVPIRPRQGEQRLTMS